jgi:outer membrane protein
MTLLAATAASAYGQDASADADTVDESTPYRWGLGLAALTQQQSYTGIDRFNIAIPLPYFENSWAQLMGPRLNLKLPGIEWGKDQQIAFAAGIQWYGFDGYKPGDAPIMNGMDARKGGIVAGPAVRWKNPYVDVSAEWMIDASSNSKGQRISIGLERSIHIGDSLMLTPGITATWLDKKHADYYYGVRHSEVRADRPAYVAEGTVNAEFSLRTDYRIDERWTVFGSLRYTALGSEIENSPLTDRSHETMVFMGYLYRLR